jgi:hypothetical protein
MRRLLRQRYLLHDVIDEIASLIEESHELTARKWLVRLSRVEPVARLAQAGDELRRRMARRLFDGVRSANRGVQALCDRGIELAECALERRAAQRSAPVTRAAEGAATLAEGPRQKR